MSSMVNPASATAARQASMAKLMGLRPRRRPTSDMPMPVMATLDSNFSAVGMGRTGAGMGSGYSTASEAGSPVGANTGSHTSLCCSKRTATGRPMTTSSGSASTIRVVRRTRGSSSMATSPIT